VLYGRVDELVTLPYFWPVFTPPLGLLSTRMTCPCYFFFFFARLSRARTPRTYGSTSIFLPDGRAFALTCLFSPPPSQTPGVGRGGFNCSGHWQVGFLPLCYWVLSFFSNIVPGTVMPHLILVFGASPAQSLVNCQIPLSSFSSLLKKFILVRCVCFSFQFGHHSPFSPPLPLLCFAFFVAILLP